MCHLSLTTEHENTAFSGWFLDKDGVLRYNKRDYINVTA